MTTLVVGVLNVTPDSFSDGGRYTDADAAVAHALRLRDLGADLVDIGGESTRPGAGQVDPRVEQERVLPVIRALAGSGIRISVDTMHASTALAAVAAGAAVVNDVSGGMADPDLLPAIAPTGADVVLQHWRGHSADMYAHAVYDDVVTEVIGELRGRIEAAHRAGIAPDRIVVDPGIGFGKRGEQNWAALRGLERIVAMGPRVLVGTSRKRFLTDALAGSGTVTDERRDLATAVTSVLAAQAGVWAVRVHDVGATRDALEIQRRWSGAPHRDRRGQED